MKKTNSIYKLSLVIIISTIFAGLFIFKNYKLQSSSSWNSSNSTSCSKLAYFNTVVTDANGDNAGACKLTDKTFDSNQVSCDGTNQTCNQYLEALTISTGVTKVYGGCFNSLDACIKPNGQSASFRFFYVPSSNKCLSTNHRYNADDIDVDDINHSTCLWSLDTYQTNARQVCYKSKPDCLTDNIKPTPTPTVTPTATPTSTPTMSATPTSTPTQGEPNYCGGTCGSNYNCQGGLFCSNGFCRNPVCSDESDCNCKTTPTAPPVLGVSTTTVLPKTGGGLPLVLLSLLTGGFGVYIFKKTKSLR